MRQPSAHERRPRVDQVGRGQADEAGGERRLAQRRGGRRRPAVAPPRQLVIMTVIMSDN